MAKRRPTKSSAPSRQPRRTPELLTRAEFRAAVFGRDHDRCVVCGEQAADPHHLLDRGLFPDGGYYVDNGASLCSDDHWRAERGELTPQALRELAGITRVILPPDLDPDEEYDKWGQPLHIG